MRADPDHRSPKPPARRAELLPVAARAWGLLLIFARRSPGLVLAGAAAFAISDRLPAWLLQRAHPGLGDAEFQALWMLRFGLPAVIGAGLFVAMQRMFMAGGGGFASLAQFGAWGRVSAYLIGLKAAGFAAFWSAAQLPDQLSAMLGPVSALLTLVLAAPLFAIAAICVVRLSLAPPALALGLPKAAVESWQITRGRVLRIVGVWLVTSAPVAACASALAWWGDESYLFGVLPLGLLALLLAGAVSSLLYKSYRLPLPLRPDRRPSRHRSRRTEPALAK